MIGPLEVGCGGRRDSSAEMSRPDHCKPAARGNTGMAHSPLTWEWFATNVG